MSALAIGQIISHYRIVRRLGAGGMGEVFLADDTRLGRQVALKVLASETATDSDRRARFEREARAVAALNHPGIITIHSVEEDQGLLFLTMEVVEGDTLSERIPPEGLPLDELLKISIPLTDAVGTAHQRGITHRDLKPGNVMIGHDGRVKVLDFGLAKQQLSDALGHETALPTANLTGEGRILGTVAYMAPEQALGKLVDQRSDIFSLGVVLFEMATGQKPFSGDSNVSVLSAVLKDTPPLVTDLRPHLPRELGRMVKRCLAKDPEERYQTAKDLRNDLKALKEDSDSGDLAKGSVSVSVPAMSSSVGVVASRARRVWPWAVLAAALAAVGALAAWSGSAPALPRVTSTRQITTDGISKGAPVTDGARLYFGVGRLQGASAGGSALAQVAASGGETVEFLSGAAPVILDIDASGTEMLVSHAQGLGENELAVRSILGGTERRVGDIKANSIRVYGNCAAWSPDKSHIVYTRGLEVRVARSDGSDSRILLTAPGVPFAPRWSPDGKRLRYSVRDQKTENSTLWEANVDGTGVHALLPGWTGAANPCCGVWTGDGRYYLFEAGSNIWARAEYGGLLRRTPDPVQLTSGPLQFFGVTPSQDGKRLFVVGDLAKGRLIRYDAARKEFVPYLPDVSAEGVAVSSDGQWIAYTAYPGNTLWRSRIDGSERVQLTFPPMQAALPRWSPDGSQIAFFAVMPSDTFKVYLVAAAGGAPRRATAGIRAEADPSWSPDGKQLVFGGGPGGVDDRSRSNIQLVDLRTGKTTPLPHSDGLFSPRWSPNGRYIVTLTQDSLHLRLFDVAAQSWSDLLQAPVFVGWPSWSPDSRSIVFEQTPEIRRITIADRRVETIANLTSQARAIGLVGPWLGATQDGSPVVLLDAGAHDIYALDWEAP